MAYVVIWAAVFVGLPVSGLLAAALVGAAPGSRLTLWWTLVYGGLATAFTVNALVQYWWPDDTAWNVFHILAVVLAVDAPVLSVLARRMPEATTGHKVVRALAVLACVLSAVGVFFVAGAGTGQ